MLPFDSLTGLPVLTARNLGELLRGSFVGYIDLVAFRDAVNAPFGHVVGDRVLAAVARRLSEGLAPCRVFRSGGDEFTVEVPPEIGVAAAFGLGRRVEHILAVPFDETGEGLRASVGVSTTAIEDDPLAVWCLAGARTVR